jgi:hypothetical protein
MIDALVGGLQRLKKPKKAKNCQIAGGFAKK